MYYMKWLSAVKRSIIGVICLVVGLQSAFALTVDSLLIDPPTPNCLGFRWYVDWAKGSAATCNVKYKVTGTPTWNDGLDMLLIDGDSVKTDVLNHLFAGSIFYLSPGTSYDVNLHVNNDGGPDYDTTVTVSTANFPAYFDGPNKIHLYPAGFSGTKLTPNYSDLGSAISAASAGTVILVHAGTYSNTGIMVGKSGTSTAPLVIRAAGDGEAIFDGGGASNIFNISSTQYVWLEGLTIQNGNRAIYSRGVTGSVILNNNIRNVKHGIICGNGLCHGMYIMGNTIVGTRPWYPRVSGNNDYGILHFGQGSVICYNTVKEFWDCLEISPTMAPSSKKYEPNSVANDVFNNIFSQGNDDGIEFDYCEHNIRVWNNLIMNSHSLISVQPLFGGPGYLFRNCVFGGSMTCLKLHNEMSGMMIFNNTMVECFKANPGDGGHMRNTHIRNNVFLALENDRGRYLMEAGSPDPRTTLDYNGWLDTLGDNGLLLKWYEGPAMNQLKAATIPDFFQLTGFEEHGSLVKYSDFANLFDPEEGTLYDTSEFDFRIAGPGPVDKGIHLPNITDGFKGVAPDLGALEAGDDPPQWGAPAGGFSLPVREVNEPQRTMRNIQSIKKTMLFRNFPIIKSYLSGGIYKMAIFDLRGRAISTIEDVSSENFDAAWRSMNSKQKKLPNGFYVIKLESAKSKASSLLLKMN